MPIDMRPSIQTQLLLSLLMFVGLMVSAILINQAYQRRQSYLTQELHRSDRLRMWLLQDQVSLTSFLVDAPSDPRFFALGNNHKLEAQRHYQKRLIEHLQARQAEKPQADLTEMIALIHHRDTLLKQMVANLLIRGFENYGKVGAMRFWIELPETKAPEPVASSPMGDLPHGRIFLVEDNPINPKVIARMLQKLGQRVNIASHGQEAFDTFQRETFDLILMDMQMPGIDGLEATVMIRTHEKTHRLAAIPIIALTANAMPEDRQRCIAVGMNDFLTKPLKISTLRQVLALYPTAKSTAT